MTLLQPAGKVSVLRKENTFCEFYWSELDNTMPFHSAACCEHRITSGQPTAIK